MNMFTGETEEENIDYEFKQHFVKLTEKIEKHKRAYEHFTQARKKLLSRYNHFCRRHNEKEQLEWQ